MAASLQDVLAEALRRQGTDIHISTGLHPTVRVDGDLISVTSFGVLTAEGTMVVSVGKSSSQIVVGYGDDGVLYRTLLVGGDSPTGPGGPFAPVAREVSSTFTYLGSQFREMRVDEIVVAGDYTGQEELKTSIEAVTAVPVVVSDPWKEWGIVGAPEERAGWEAAIGLAVRSLT